MERLAKGGKREDVKADIASRVIDQSGFTCMVRRTTLGGSAEKKASESQLHLEEDQANTGLQESGNERRDPLPGVEGRIR